MNRFPSYLEYSGYYNVPRDPVTEEELSGPDPNEAFPELTTAEIRAAMTAVEAVLARTPVPPGTWEDAATYFRYCVHDEIVDRTVTMDLPDIDLLTVDLIARLQAKVLATRPLWRVMITGASPDTVVLVYPRVVRAGDLPPSMPLGERLRHVVKRTREIEEPTAGPQRRQVAWIRPLVRERLPLLRSRACVFLAAFDNYKGDQARVSLWFLHRDSFEFRLAFPLEVASSERIPVSPDGELGRAFAPVDADAWVSQWLIPREAVGKVVVENVDDGTREELVLTPADILTT